MSLRGSFRPAFRAIHPSLFLVGFAVVVLEVILSFGMAALQSLLPQVYGALLAPLGSVLILAVTLPLLVALYVPVAEGTTTTRETMLSAARAVRRWYPSVFAADVVALLAAIGMGFLFAALWAVLGTGISFVRYTALDHRAPHFMWAIAGLAGSLGVGLIAGVLTTRFADVFVVFEDGRPRTAWRSSLTFARRHPVSFLGYAAVMALLLGVQRVLSFAFGAVDSPGLLLAGVGSIVVVGTVGTVLAAAIHVTYFRRTVVDATDSARPAPIDRRRVALAAVVLLAAVAGAGYVRMADLGAGQAEIQSLPDDETAAYAVAANNTREANHRQTVEVRNASAGESFRRVERRGVDYDDRQFYLFIEGEDIVLGGFFAEGTLATRHGGGLSTTRTTPYLAWERDNWTVMALPGYGLTAPQDDPTSVPDPAADWRLVEQNESTLVYRVDRPGEIRTAVQENYRGLHATLAEDSYVEAVVDRERDVVNTIRYDLHNRENGNRFVYRIRYEDVGTADVERPDEIGPRQPAEWLWDVLYY